MSKKLTITVSEGMFRNVEKLGVLFPWLVKGASDYGRLIEERTSWLFEEQANDPDQLATQVENFDFDSKDEAAAMLARYRKYASPGDPASVRLYPAGDRWNIKFFQPGSQYEQLWDVCHDSGLDYTEHLVLMGMFAQGQGTAEEFREKSIEYVSSIAAGKKPS